MSGSVNSVLIIGNLGADPDVRTTAAGQMVATLSIATSETFTDKQGQRQERVEWHRVVVWGKTAELAQRYLAKGRKVCVQGRIQTRSWDDQQTGAKRYSTEIQCDRLTFLDSGKGGDEGHEQRTGGGGHGQGNSGSGRGGGGYDSRAAARPPAGGGSLGPPNGPPDENAPFGYGPNGEVLDDDVPF